VRGGTVRNNSHEFEQLLSVTLSCSRRGRSSTLRPVKVVCEHDCQDLQGIVTGSRCIFFLKAKIVCGPSNIAKNPMFETFAAGKSPLRRDCGNGTTRVLIIPAMGVDCVFCFVKCVWILLQRRRFENPSLSGVESRRPSLPHRILSLPCTCENGTKRLALRVAMPGREGSTRSRP